MPSFPTDQLLRGLRRDTEELIQIAEREFVPLTAETLLWKPAPDKWSVAQCLEHLNRYGLHYLPAMQTRIDGALTRGSRPTPTFRAGWLGDFFVRTVQPMHTGSPRANRKYPAPKAYDPNRTGTTTAEALPTFLRQQQTTLALLERAQRVNLQSIRVPISITPLIRLRLGDCLRFVIVHNQRHVQQARKVVEKWGG
ncbi:MAG TPA: DinB family protein [Cytophagales bacterium]